jgi:hypothetical protein
MGSGRAAKSVIEGFEEYEYLMKLEQAQESFNN